MSRLYLASWKIWKREELAAHDMNKTAIKPRERYKEVVRNLTHLSYFSKL